MTFATLGLSAELLDAVTQAGYTEPTPIQAQAIPVILGGRDVLGIAQTGTGKTASFVLPMIDRLARGRARARMPRTLILEPTRELAAQVSENFVKYGVNHKLSMALLIGGVSFGDQDRLLTQGVDVLIATPGRLLDHFERGRLLLTGVEMLVIDEADRMLDMGFIPDIERICTLLPPRRQTMLFSATMPPEIARLAQRFQTEPERIAVSSPTATADTITQKKVVIRSSDARAKRAALRAVIRSCTVKNGIVFCNRKTDVDVVAKSLQKHGFDAAPIHGDLAQSYRMQTLDRFRSGELTLLVASDVAARGLDIPDVGHVFNYAPPPNADDYVHRIGRTGRAGRKGESYTIVAPSDGKLWDAVVKRIGQDPENFTPEGLEDAVAEAIARPEPKSSGRRGEKSRDSGRSRRPRKEAAEPEATTADAADEPAAKPEKSARPARADKAEKPEPRAEAAPTKRERSPRRSGRRNDDEIAPAADGVSGFGEHVPAFMLQPGKDDASSGDAA